MTPPRLRRRCALPCVSSAAPSDVRVWAWCSPSACKQRDQNGCSTGMFNMSGQLLMMSMPCFTLYTL